MKGRWAALILFVLAVLLAGLAIGYATRPGEWYSSLDKPPFTPPNWIFAPVWTTLYVMIAVAGWYVKIEQPDAYAFRLWMFQLLLNFLWSPLFFAGHLVGAALIVILALLASVVTFASRTWTTARPASLLFIPYALWVAYALALNTGIWALNPFA
ncbi:TspO/MBR family protein [Nitratireductor basaltis]|uniref:Tryptophan-rich sensory protein n=1 Tax=Nitratireductor basaltis TaxID=472175 RepID=A0A084UCY7_9HYPH|nr:TspO/MBR family protein [Nitratireductor basaltis]KFB10823.1 Tryptophan-rich sensory protein [Nitratireductor basaltis]